MDNPGCAIQITSHKRFNRTLSYLRLIWRVQVRLLSDLASCASLYQTAPHEVWVWSGPLSSLTTQIKNQYNNLCMFLELTARTWDFVPVSKFY